jgi:Concanavalin A-like lectin/glucanases superfamily/Domain of unknown function (DUF2341)
MKTVIRIFVASMCIGMSMSCSRNVFQASDAGGGSEVTNGASAYVRYSDGTPAVSAQVFVRSQRFLKDTSRVDSSRVPDVYTDESGFFKIDSLKPGNYFVEVNDTRRHAICMACTIGAAAGQPANLGTDTLRPTGTIRGTINRGPAGPSTELYVQIYGLDRVTKVNAATGIFSFDMLPPGYFSLRVVSSSPAVPAVDAAGIAVSQADTASAQVSLWKSSMNLFLNTTPTGAQIASNVVNFPVLVRLTSSNFTFSQAQTYGQDIRFTKSGGVPLPYEIELWDSANAQAEIWVGVDTIFGNDQTHYVTMFWGNPNAQDGANSSAVFDTASGFQGVWHLGEPGNTVRDATGNHYDGTRFGMTAQSAVPGAIGTAQEFNGVSSYIEMMGTASGKLDFPENGTYMVSAWAYEDTLDGIHDEIASKGWYQYFLEVGSNNTWEFNVLKSAVGWDNSHWPATAKSWSHIVGVRSNTSQYLYVNGTCVDSIVKMGNQTASLRSSSANFKIGTHSGVDPFPWFFKGKIDEVRVLSVAPGADWVKLCYMNQKASDALVTFK